MMMSSPAVGRSPGRVNLIGEHTDYNDGFVLPIALGAIAQVTAVPRTDNTITIGSVQLNETVALDQLAPGQHPWWGYVAGVVWALRERSHPVGGVDLALDSSVPLGGGLSSSAAIESATVLALDRLFALDLRPAELAEAAQAAENDFLGIPTGPMDQRASLWCQADHCLLLDCRTLTPTQIPFQLPAELTLMLIDTRSPHMLADGHYAQRRASCQAAAAALGVRALRDVTDLETALTELTDSVLGRRARHVITENARTLAAAEALRGDDWDTFGGLMTQSHASMRDDYDITVPTVDQAVESALAAGALGSRMTGGGFGGTVLALIPTERAQTLREQVLRDYAARGFEAPLFSTARASDGGIALTH